VRPAVTLNPATPACTLGEVLNAVEMVLVLTVNPGFGGQTFVESTLDKISQIRAMLDEAGSEADIEADGGIDPQTAERVAAAGANVLVSGTYVFRAPEGIAATIKALREAAQRGQAKSGRK